MIFAIDIETIPNPDCIPFLHPPEISKVLKDPAKIAAARAEAKEEQVSKMALDAMTGRVCACALVGVDGSDDFSSVAVATGTDDASEMALLAMIFTALGRKDTRIVTYNGMGFDLPFLYKRAMILGLQLGEYGAPPLTAWTKRYSTDRHCDLMKVWTGRQQVREVRQRGQHGVARAQDRDRRDHGPRTDEDRGGSQKDR